MTAIRCFLFSVYQYSSPALWIAAYFQITRMHKKFLCHQVLMPDLFCKQEVAQTSQGIGRQTSQQIGWKMDRRNGQRMGRKGEWFSGLWLYVLSLFRFLSYHEISLLSFYIQDASLRVYLIGYSLVIVPFFCIFFVNFMMNFSCCLF